MFFNKPHSLLMHSIQRSILKWKCQIKNSTTCQATDYLSGWARWSIHFNWGLQESFSYSNSQFMSVDTGDSSCHVICPQNDSVTCHKLRYLFVCPVVCQKLMPENHWFCLSFFLSPISFLLPHIIQFMLFLSFFFPSFSPLSFFFCLPPFLLLHLCSLSFILST